MAPRPIFALVVAVVLMSVALLTGRARAIDLPPQFVAQSAVPGVTFDFPTALAFLPDGRLLVAEKRGRLWMVTNGVRATEPLWDERDEVFVAGDCGILDVTVDPHFYQNHFIYLLYVVEPDSDGFDDDDDAFGRLTRYQVAFDDSSTLVESSRTILMGTTWSNAPCVGAAAHAGGSLRWGEDGTLLVSVGDGGHYAVPDPGGLDPGMFGPGKVDPSLDIGAYRAQDIGSLNGKILRLDPETGWGLPSNPFWNGDPDAARSKVFAYGLRNPFRFAIAPGTGSTDQADGRPGTLWIGDVGWAKWEELDVAVNGGLNFGWPCREGFPVDTDYVDGPQPSRMGCGTAGSAVNPSTFHAPLAVTSHYDSAGSVPPGVMGNCIITGSFVTNPNFPSGYRGLYVADFGAGWIRVFHPLADSLGTFTDFATNADGPVDLEVDPVTGDPVYVAINTGQVMRLRYIGGPNHSPVAVAAASPTAGPSPLVVTFSSAGTNDPDGDLLAYGWNFGDGQGSTIANPVHTYASPGSYLAILNVSDGVGGVAIDSVTILVSDGGAFPSTSVLDDFNRPSGALGGAWIAGSSHLVITNNRMTENTSAPAAAVWPELFSQSQEAWFFVPTLSSTATKQALMLKVFGTDSTAAHVEVSYNAQQHQVKMSLWDPATRFQTFAGPWAVHLLAGDRFGARVYANGRVEAYRNTALIGAGNISGWPYLPATGRIGFVLTGATGARHDDFGGGSFVLDHNTAPQSVVRAPADSGFYAEGDTVRLVGAGWDAQDDSTRLTYRWDVFLHHNNHVHPILSSDSSVVTYVGENHDDGTGVWIDNRLIVTDTGLLADTMDVHLFPQVDVRPTGLVTIPSTPGTTAPALYRFTLHNDGRMPSPLVHWILRGDNLLVAQGDTLVAALDSVVVSKWGSPVLTAGNHTLRVVADTAAAFAIVEPDENDNASTRAVTVVSGPGPDEFPPLFVGLPWAAAQPGNAIIRWTNNEPTHGVVRFGLSTALGDSAVIDSAGSNPSTSHAIVVDNLVAGLTCFYVVVASDGGGNTSLAAADSFVTLPPLGAPNEALPRTLALSNAFPNPARGRVALQLALPRPAPVGVEVIDLAGRLVWSETQRTLAAGRWPIVWPGVTRRGRGAEPGIYLVRVTVGADRLVRRAVLLR